MAVLYSVRPLVRVLASSTVGRTLSSFFFFFNDTAPPEFSPLPLHAALPISLSLRNATLRAAEPEPHMSPAPPIPPPPRILGLDPGLQVTGYAVLEASDDGPKVRDAGVIRRSEEHTSELQSPCNLVCRLLLEK